MEKSAPHIVLASRSPRRADILTFVDLDFRVMPANVDETRFPDEAADVYVKRLALAKARKIAEQHGEVVLGADTVVVIEEHVLGQPRDAEDARQMLQRLSGKWHQVITGVALVSATNSFAPVVAQEVTRVKFGEMSDSELDWYVATGEPMDKAGAYAVQGRGALFIERIEGDFFNVMGLPIRLVYGLLRQLGFLG